MTTKVKIRAYVDADAAAVITIAKELQTHQLTVYDRLKPVECIDESYLAALWKDVEKRDGTFLVAEYEGAVVGYCTLLTHCDTTDEADEMFYRYSRVGDLAVSAENRSHGVGKALLEACETIAKKAGIKWLSLGVLAKNTRARQFYAREGFFDAAITMDKSL